MTTSTNNSFGNKSWATLSEGLPSRTAKPPTAEQLAFWTKSFGTADVDRSGFLDFYELKIAMLLAGFHQLYNWHGRSLFDRQPVVDFAGQNVRQVGIASHLELRNFLIGIYKVPLFSSSTDVR